MIDVTFTNLLLFYSLLYHYHEGSIPKKTCQNTLKKLDDINHQMNPIKILAVVQENISEELLKDHYIESNPLHQGKREVILSLYMTNE